MKKALRIALFSVATIGVFAFALTVSREASRFFARHGWYQTEVQAQAGPRLREVVLFDNYDLNSTSFIYCDTGSPPAGVACSTGSATDDGWITVASEELKAFEIDIAALTATSVEVQVEARLRDSGGNVHGFIIWPTTSPPTSLTTTGADGASLSGAYYQIRVGIKITSDTAGAEDIEVVYNSFGRDRR